MLRKKEMTVVLLIGIFYFSTVWAEERTITTRDPKTGRTITKKVEVAEKQLDPYEDMSVLVEAFMVRVSAEVLAEVGVNPIGQAPEGISILKILACLDNPEKAEVISAAKVNCRHNNESRVKKEDRFYIKRELEGSVELKQYSSGKTFEVMPRIQPEGSIRLEAAYSDLIIIENEDPMIPPAETTYDWSGALALQSGIPAIAGAAQDDDMVIFLILTATIQNSQNTGKD